MVPHPDRSAQHRGLAWREALAENGSSMTLAPSTVPSLVGSLLVLPDRDARPAPSGFLLPTFASRDHRTHLQRMERKNYEDRIKPSSEHPGTRPDLRTRHTSD